MFVGREREMNDLNSRYNSGKLWFVDNHSWKKFDFKVLMEKHIDVKLNADWENNNKKTDIPDQKSNISVIHYQILSLGHL